MMNCKQAYDDIALFVGNDLSDEAIPKLESHLENCPNCNKHYQSMKNSWKLLHESGDQFLVESLHDSVWPDVSVKLAKRQEERHQFNGWIPAAAVLAASFVVFLVSDVSIPHTDNSDPSIHTSFSTSPISLPGVSNAVPMDENELKLDSEKNKKNTNRIPENLDPSDKFLNLIYSPSK